MTFWADFSQEDVTIICSLGFFATTIIHAVLFYAFRRWEIEHDAQDKHPLNTMEDEE